MHIPKNNIILAVRHSEKFMRKTMPLLTLIILLNLLSLPTFAQWYEAQGHASLSKYSLAVARTKATENALKKALLVAGASVSSLQQVVNGLLTQDEISIRASGSVNSIELLDELHIDNTLQVSIRADIVPQENKCLALDFKKTIVLTQSQISHREQANIGQIYPINRAFIQHLNQRIGSHSHYANTKLLLKNSTSFTRLNQSFEEEEIKKLAISLADNSDSQYVLFSEINDLSFEQERTNPWKIWQQGTYPRYFNFTLYLYNGLSGELVWQKYYQNSAVWAYNKRTAVDVQNADFWQSEYGKMIDTLTTKAVTDIDENIMCEPSEGKILQVAGNKVVINLGRHHGVKMGDEFSLLHINNFTSDNGKHYPSYNISPYKVKVTQLTKQSASAVTLDNNLLGNIQINDLAVRF